MSGEFVDHDPVELLAADFLDRLREGENPTIEEYVERHPEHAERIGSLFPTIAAIENSKKPIDLGQRSKQFASLKLDRLNDFTIVREIGRGGMGIVYEAIQESLNRRVALKVLPKQMLLKRKSLERFQREAKTAAQLHHTNIVPILGVGQCDGYHYYVMQLIPGVGLDEILNQLVISAKKSSQTVEENHGETLDLGEGSTKSTAQSAAMAMVNGSHGERGSESFSMSGWTDEEIQLQNQKSNSRKRSILRRSPTKNTQSILGAAYWKNVAKIGLESADALSFAHAQGFLHRDVKPANILLDEKGNTWIADFGLAKSLEQDQISQTGDIVGTLRYMAPEQASGQASELSDIYSLGITLYELLTLQSAFDSKSAKSRFRADETPASPRSINPDIPKDIETIVMKAIDNDPLARYENAEMMARDLESFVNDAPISARRASPLERFGRWHRKNWKLATACEIAAALLVLLVASLAYGYIYYQSLSKREAELIAKSNEAVDLSLKTLDDFVVQFAPERELDSFDVSENQTIVHEPLAVSDQTADFLHSLSTLYDRFADLNDANIDDTILRSNSARASKRVGDIHFRLGRYSDAFKSYQKAFACYELLEQETDLSFRFEVAVIENRFANIARQQAKPLDAKKHYINAVNILQGFHQDNEIAQYELAKSKYYLARIDLLSKDQEIYDQAFVRLANAQEMFDSLISRNPKFPDYKLWHARCLKTSSRSVNDPNLNRAIDTLNKLIAEQPKIQDYKFELCETMAKFSKANTRNQFGLVRSNLVQAAKNAENLDANIPHYVLARSDVNFKLGILLIAQLPEIHPRPRKDYFDEINFAFNESIRMITKLANKFPANRYYLLRRAQISSDYLFALSVMPGLEPKQYDDLVNQSMKDLNRIIQDKELKNDPMKERAKLIKKRLMNQNFPMRRRPF